MNPEIERIWKDEKGERVIRQRPDGMFDVMGPYGVTVEGLLRVRDLIDRVAALPENAPTNLPASEEKWDEAMGLGHPMAAHPLGAVGAIRNCGCPSGPPGVPGPAGIPADSPEPAA